MKLYKTLKSSALIFGLFFLLPGLVFAQESGKVIKTNLKDLRNPQAAIRLGAIRDLSRIGTDQAIKVLIEQLKTETDAYLKIQIVEALTVYQSTTTSQAIISALDDLNPKVRQAAAINLGCFTDESRVVPELARILNNDQDIAVKMSALNTLGQYKKDSVEAIDKVLANRNSDKKLRLLAVHSLGNIGSKAAKTKLEKYKNDSDPEVKKAVKKALEKL